MRAKTKLLPDGLLLRNGLLIFLLCISSTVVAASAQESRNTRRGDAEFGPIVRAYLGYLREQQEVVDDRVSRREIDRNYYRHNSNRIRALREMAIRIARENDNDYLPELEAVSLGEFDQLFEDPVPRPEALTVGETLNYQLRFLGALTSGREKFYLFARLDPYEQAELRKKSEAKQQSQAGTGAAAQPVTTVPRPRRVNAP